jgi:MoaD family protein
MPWITVRFFSRLREHLGLAETQMEIGSEYTVQNLLNELTAIYGPYFEEIRTADPFEGYVLGDGANPSIVVNGRPIDMMRELGKKLQDGDRVTIVPILSGG